MSKQYAEVSAYYITETNKAVCVTLEEDSFDREAKRYWVPRKVIDGHERHRDVIILRVEQWFAEREELL